MKNPLEPAAPDLNVDELSPDVQIILKEFAIAMERYEALMHEYATTGTVDRQFLRECLESYGELRHKLLTALGENPASEELLPLPAVLNHA